MKNVIKTLFLAVFVAAFFSACQKETVFTDQSTDSIFLKEGVAGVESTPESVGGIIPYIIDGANQGGNRTCAEVSAAFGIDFDFSSGRINYEDQPNGGTVGPITWTTDGKFVSWTSTVPVKVAFIVKGSNDANVYVYDVCTSGDSGLASPVAGGSGGAADLSNITICYTLCETDECFKGETAFGGNYAGGGRAWWFYYDTQGPLVQDIFAGQQKVEGASVKVEGGFMVINLGGMALAPTNEPVKVQGYAFGKLPKNRPSAGLFTTYKGVDLTFPVAPFRYYAIHLDVLVPTACPE